MLYFSFIQVYVASNVELVTKTRTEHLTDTDKKKYKASRSAFQSFLGIMEVDERTNTMQVFGVIYYLLFLCKFNYNKFMIFFNKSCNSYCLTVIVYLFEFLEFRSNFIHK